jgi:hypothetical protein
MYNLRRQKIGQTNSGSDGRFDEIEYGYQKRHSGESLGSKH